MFNLVYLYFTEKLKEISKFFLIMLSDKNFYKTIKKINNYSEKGFHNSFQISIFFDGDQINFCGGYARVDSKLRWFSSGKPITAIAISQLVARKLLRYDNKIIEILPDFQGLKSNITIHNVLTHTIGLSEAENANSLNSSNEIIDYICRSKQISGWVNGKRAGYQPTAGWHILGKVIEKITGQIYEKYIKENILDPLKMINSQSYGSPDIKTFNTLKSPNEESFPKIPRNFPKPGSSFIGPASDLLKIYQMLLNFGKVEKVSILDESNVKDMISSQRGMLYDETFQYSMDWGLGIMLNNSINTIDVPYGYGKYASRRSFGHGGIQSSIGFADPLYNLAVVIIFDGQPGESRHKERMQSVIEILYADLGII